MRTVHSALHCRVSMFHMHPRTAALYGADSNWIVTNLLVLFPTGFPSVGKSTLLSNLAGVYSEVAAYEFTTLTTVPGVIKYKGAKIQLLDLPGIIEGAKDGKGRGKQVIAGEVTRFALFFFQGMKFHARLFCEKPQVLTLVVSDKHVIYLQIQANSLKVGMTRAGLLEHTAFGKVVSQSEFPSSVARTCSIIFIVLDVLKPLQHKKLIEHELEGFGIRLNKTPPNIGYRRKDKGGINFTSTVSVAPVCFVAAQSEPPQVQARCRR